MAAVSPKGIYSYRLDLWDGLIFGAAMVLGMLGHVTHTVTILEATALGLFGLSVRRYLAPRRKDLVYDRPTTITGSVWALVLIAVGVVILMIGALAAVIAVAGVWEEPRAWPFLFVPLVVIAGGVGLCLWARRLRA